MATAIQTRLGTIYQVTKEELAGLLSDLEQPTKKAAPAVAPARTATSPER